MNEQGGSGTSYSKGNLEAIIAERKLTKKLLLKEKFRNERETITSELLRLPPEIMEIIFSSVTEPPDLYSIARASHKLYEIAKRNNPLLLLPKVLSILHERKFVNADEIRTIRKASKWFRFSYDWAFYQSRFCSKDWVFKFERKHEEQKIGLWKLEDRDDAIYLFPTPLNPFRYSSSMVWIRSVEVGCGNQWSMDLLRFLELHGSSIWLFKVYEQFPQVSETYIRVHEWVSHLVNLKVLIIIGWQENRARSAEDLLRLSEVYDKEDIDRLREAPAFPTIPSLQIYEGLGLPFSGFSEKILSANPSVKRVSLFPRYQEDASSQVLRSLNVEGLDNTSKSYERWEYQRPFLQVYERAGCQWPLKRVTLSFNPGDFSLSELVRFLNLFKPTLEQVFLNFYKIHNGSYNPRIEVPPNLSLDLPNVRVFGFHHFRAFFPLHLIYPMVSLEKLDLSLELVDEERSVTVDPYDGLIDFYPCLFANRLWDSNIWEFFPSLIEVLFKTYVYYDDEEFATVAKTEKSLFEKKGRKVTVVRNEKYYCPF